MMVGLAVVVAVLTVVIFFGQAMIFRSTDMPPMSLLPAFIFLCFWDALSFGVGIALSGASPPNYVYLALVEYVFHVPWLIFAVTLGLVVRHLVRANK